MRIVADTSFLLSLYLTDSHSELARAQAIEEGQPLIVSPLARLEFINGLEQWVFRKHLTKEQALVLRRCFENDHRIGNLVFGPSLLKDSWEASFSLSETYTSRFGSRSLDILHVAYAQSLKASDFWSFDVRQRTLATSVDLTVNQLD